MPRNKVSKADAEMIRAFQGYVKPATLASEFDCTTDNIYLILHGKTHKGYTRPRSDRSLSDAKVREIKGLISCGLGDTKISSKTGATRGAIYQIRIGKSYKDVT